CGMAKAKYYLLTADSFTGEEAERMNLISLALDDAEVEGRAVEIATRLALGPKQAISWTKQALNMWMRQAAPIFEASLALELTGMASPEGREGMDAFLAKRKPDFASLKS
ncbi:MAG: enoyl-CoA hydratase-related protein, partial [Burkholderiaceae bacterium]|nr:enoyl-CoA hydratase-related protein [Burkholderiaceae bacterium]